MLENKKINWIDANADWMRQILWDYSKNSQSIGMNYLSMGSLRYNEKYFVGYIYNELNSVCPIELVSYIQYQLTNKKLILNYMEVAENHRKQGISRQTIDAFSKSVYTMLKNNELEVIVTTFSHDGKESDLEGKLQEYLNTPLNEMSKRNII